VLKDTVEFIIWLWKKIRRREIAKDAEEAGELERKQTRLVLSQTVVRLNADRLILFKLKKMVRVGRASEDIRLNAMSIVESVDRFNTPVPSVSKLPMSLDMADLFDMQHLPESIFEDFWEWPDRSKMAPSAFCACMKNFGAMASLCHHVKNSQGSVVGMIGALYYDTKEFTDIDRDMMKQIGRQLQLILSWLAGNHAIS